MNISRVSDQNGVSLLYIMLEIHHSGQEPSIYTHTDTHTCVCVGGGGRGAERERESYRDI